MDGWRRVVGCLHRYDILGCTAQYCTGRDESMDRVIASMIRSQFSHLVVPDANLMHDSQIS